MRRINSRCTAHGSRLCRLGRHVTHRARQHFPAAVLLPANGRHLALSQGNAEGLRWASPFPAVVLCAHVVLAAVTGHAGSTLAYAADAAAAILALARQAAFKPAGVNAIPGKAWLAGAAEAGRDVGAHGVLVARPGGIAGGALIHVQAGPPVSSVPRAARALEASGCVATRGLRVTVVAA